MNPAAINEDYANGETYVSRRVDPEQHARYKEVEAARIKQFREDLMEHLHVADHPKADLLWRLAWEHGHSSGLTEVYYFACEFSELMR